MNQTTRTTIIIATLLTAVLVTILNAQGTTHANGRFQIIAGSYTFGDTHVMTEHTVFKMDTSTGQAWVYIVGKNADGKIFNKWASIQQ